MRIVGAAHELKVDEVANEQVFAAAEHLGDDKGRDRRHEHHRDARDDARDAERYDDAAEHEMGRCAEILRRLDQPAVELDEHGVDGQHHERQEVVDHAEHDRALRVDERNIVERVAEMRLQEGNQADRAEKSVEEAVVFQNGHPCVGAQQKVHPHRQHDEHHAQALTARGQTAHDVRHRVAEDETHDRREQREPERAGEDRQTAGQTAEVRQSEAAVRGPEGVEHDEKDGRDDKDRHPYAVGVGK